MGSFSYSAQIVERFPNIRAGVIHATDLVNGPSPDRLLDDYRAGQRSAMDELSETPLSEIPGIAAWRRAFTTFGVKPTQYRSAAESLLRRLTKQGDIPSINALVDIANLVSIRHRLPVAVFDQSDVTGSTTVRFATGDEVFTDLGTVSTASPERGEVIFVDDASLVSARRWCWRQSAQSAAGTGTVEALITVESQHDESGIAVRQATEALLELIGTHLEDASTVHGFLSPESPRFEF